MRISIHTPRRKRHPRDERAKPEGKTLFEVFTGASADVDRSFAGEPPGSVEGGTDAP